MKRAFYSFCIILILALLLPGCKKEHEAGIQSDVSGRLVSHTGCKNFSREKKESPVTPDSLSCIDYSYDPLSHTLELKHINAGFNCCPDSLFCNISFINDTLIIQEFEKEALCRCNCLYDLNITLLGVSPQNYQVKFVEPYTGSQEKILFEVNLNQQTDGTFCVTRKKYPWGIMSIHP
jgi:hypothetical protein